MAVSGAAVGALKRLREVRWDDGLRLALTEPLERELGAITHGLVARLMGQHPRSSRYLGQLRQSVTRVAEGSAPQFG
jgi:hypothetical protein